MRRDGDRGGHERRATPAADERAGRAARERGAPAPRPRAARAVLSRGASSARNAAGAAASSPSARGSSSRSPASAPSSVARFQHDEHGGAGGPEPEPGLGRGVAPDGHRRALVDHELRGERRAGAGTARAAARRARCARRAAARCATAATAPPPISPTNANCDAPVNISSDSAHACGTDRPGGDRERAEREARRRRSRRRSRARRERSVAWSRRLRRSTPHLVPISACSTRVR